MGSVARLQHMMTGRRVVSVLLCLLQEVLLVFLACLLVEDLLLDFPFVKAGLGTNAFPILTMLNVM